MLHTPHSFALFCFAKLSLITTVSQGRVSFALFIVYTTGKSLLICPSDRLLFSQTFYRFNLSLTSLLSKSSTRTGESHHYHSAIKKRTTKVVLLLMAGTTRLELATSCVTGMRSNQTELRSHVLVTIKFYMLKKKLQ